MPKQIVIAEQHRIAAIFFEDRVEELVVSGGNQQVSDIFLGLVENVIPGIDAAFINIGDSERNGFMHVSDLGPLRLRRSAGAITELVAPQQKVLVQIIKEPTGNKGPRLTGNLSLPGRYLVMMPSGRGVNLSRRIESESERSRLRALAILIKPAGMGLLVRTEAEGQPEEAIMEDLEALKRQWESIQQQAATTRAPALLNRDEDFVQRVLRDIFSSDVNRIVVDTPAGVKRIKQQLASWSGGKMPGGVTVDRHTERQPILEFFRISAAIREAIKPRVDLPSGGYIIIEPTEALTVIDVNSGSFTRSATARETVLWTNTEAATEIARQLRLRRIGGVIVVDFIDMDSRRDQLKVLEHFTNQLKADKARPQIAQLSELGLVELTRKRQGQSLYELFSRPCPTCGGLGHVSNLPGEEENATSLVAAGVAVPPPARVITAPARSAPASNDLDALLDATTDDDSLELDLASHPSYQEAGSGGGGSRRRRRRNETRGDARSDARSDSRSDNGKSEPRRRQSGRGKAPDADKAAAAVAETAPEPTAKKPEQKASKTEQPEKDKPRQKSASEPRPKIAVEMTPLEQEVYALMGLSPLVRLDRRPEDLGSGRSRQVVTAVAPGAPPTTRAAIAENGSSTPSNTSGSADSAADSDAMPEPAPEPVAIAAEEPTGAPEANRQDSGSTGDASGESPASGDRRIRRRRRSSAKS